MDSTKSFRALLFISLTIVISISTLSSGASAFPGWKFVAHFQHIYRIFSTGRDSAFLASSETEYEVTQDEGRTWSHPVYNNFGNVQSFYPGQFVGAKGLGAFNYTLPFPHRQDVFYNGGAFTDDGGETWNSFSGSPNLEGQWIGWKQYFFWAYTDAATIILHWSGPSKPHLVACDSGTTFFLVPEALDTSQQLVTLFYTHTKLQDTVQYFTLDAWNTFDSLSHPCPTATRVADSVWIGVDGQDRIWRTESLKTGWKPTTQTLPIDQFYTYPHGRIVYATLRDDSSFFYGKIARSLDLGVTWQLQQIETTSTPIKMVMAVWDENIAWVGTSSGNVYRTSTAGVDAVAFAASSSQPSRLFPNPTTHGIQLQTFASKEQRSITLYDPLGRVVFFRTLEPGETSAALDLSRVPSGVYLARIGSEVLKVVKS